MQAWRRSYETPPPGGESLQQTQARVAECFHERILAATKTYPCVLVVAHGNSLRALIMHLEGLGPEAIEGCEIATGEPRLYQSSCDTFVRIED